MSSGLMCCDSVDLGVTTVALIHFQEFRCPTLLCFSSEQHGRAISDGDHAR